MKTFNFDDLMRNVKQDHSFLALRVLGGWRMEVTPDIDTLSPDRLWSCRVGVSFGLYPWTVSNLKVSSEKKNGVGGYKRKLQSISVAAADVPDVVVQDTPVNVNA